MLSKELSKKIKDDRGITLVALVVTVIILLVLACISMFMLTSQERDKSSYSENEVLEAKEHVMSTANKILSEFYTEKYDNNNETIKDIEPQEYIIKELQNELDSKYASVSGNTITLKPTNSNGEVITGVYNENRTIEWSN